MKYSDGRTLIEASRWEKIGDHPDDKSKMVDHVGCSEMSDGIVVRRIDFSKHPDEYKNSTCTRCGKKLYEHGEIAIGPNTGNCVHPGDWIVGIGINYYQPYSENLFSSIYKKAY